MVAIIVPLVAIIDGMIVVQGRRNLDWRRVLPMILSGAVGIPLGTFILLVIPAEALKFAIGIIVLLFALALLAGYSLNIRRERLAGSIAGFLSGASLTSTSLSGPPVALFMINQRWARDNFRTSQGLFHVVTDVLGAFSLAVGGVVTLNTLVVNLALLPAALGGYALAILLLPHIKQELFRRITILIVIIAAVMAIGSVVAGGGGI